MFENYNSSLLPVGSRETEARAGVGARKTIPLDYRLTRLGLARAGVKECLAHRDTVVRFRARVGSGLDPSRHWSTKFLTELVPGQRTRLQPK